MKDEFRHQRDKYSILPKVLIAIFLTSGVLITLFGVKKAARQASQISVISPTLTPSPTRLPTRTPPPTEQTFPSIVSTPALSPEQPFYAISKPSDAIAIVKNDYGFQQTMGELFFGAPPNLINTGAPIYVKALNGDYPDGYYIIPFYKEGQVIGLAAVGLLGDKGRLVNWSRCELAHFPPISMAEALSLLNQYHIRIIGIPELSYSDWRITPHFRYGGNPNAPFWLVRTTNDEKIFILYNFQEDKPIIYNQTHDLVIE